MVIAEAGSDSQVPLLLCLTQGRWCCAESCLAQLAYQAPCITSTALAVPTLIGVPGNLGLECTHMTVQQPNRK